ncbi:MAG: hypothetical protein ACFFBH_11470 [Promethearchaeota archaeon]
MATIIQLFNKYQNENINNLNEMLLKRFSEIFKVTIQEAEFFINLYLVLPSEKININGNYTYEFHNIFHTPRHRSHFIGTKENQVVSLNLTNLKLNIIPESIWRLKSLKYLTMNYSNLKNLPKNIRYLKKLKYLSLIGNKLKNLPPSLLYLKKLRYLNLKQNSLNFLPEGIGQLVNLKNLNLLYNDIQELPDSIYELAKGKRSKRYVRSGVEPQEASALGLFEILIGFKLIKISEQLLRLMKSKQMLLHEANYYILDENGHVVKIFLYSRSPILSIIPKNISNLKYLEELYLYTNEIRTLPSTIQILHNLKELHLSESKIKAVPAGLKKFINSIKKFSY